MKFSLANKHMENKDNKDYMVTWDKWSKDGCQSYLSEDNTWVSKIDEGVKSNGHPVSHSISPLAESTHLFSSRYHL